MSNETRFVQHRQPDPANNSSADAEMDLESLRQAALIPLFRDRGATAIDPPSGSNSDSPNLVDQSTPPAIDETPRVINHLLHNTYSQMVSNIPGRVISTVSHMFGVP